MMKIYLMHLENEENIDKVKNMQNHSYCNFKIIGRFQVPHNPFIDYSQKIITDSKTHTYADFRICNGFQIPSISSHTDLPRETV